MELVINLTHDTLRYDKEQKEGVLNSGNLFGYTDFAICELPDGFEVDFWNEEGKVFNFPCKFTDHGLRLVVEI